MNNKINQKIILTVFTLLFIPAGIDAYAEERPFITTWSISETDKSLEIPTTGTGYNYTIDWGDGTIDTEQTGNAFHTYDSAGTYTVSISGDFARINLYGSPSAEKLITVDQWGDIEWTSMSNAFSGAKNMNMFATDEPDLSRVTDMDSMFHFAHAFNGDISNWDVSSVTDMHGMFHFAHAFNGDISNWDVSSVTDMHGMFSHAHAFNADINGWDTSSVTDMHGMFSHAHAFNGDISNWDVSSVTDMSYMASHAHGFNTNMSNWDVSSVTDMRSMLSSAESFNGDISNWDVSSVTDMSNMLINNSLSTSNYDKLFDNWSKLPTLQNNVSFASHTKYCDAGEIGRSILIDIYGWDITDAGKDICENMPILNAPIITSLVVDDPDNLDEIYSINDIITITFDSDTNMPGGINTQTKAAVNDLFVFTEPIGHVYRGQWITPDTFTIIIKSTVNAGPPIIDTTTVTPSGVTPILSYGGTSESSTVTSPVLSGDFGIIS